MFVDCTIEALRLKVKHRQELVCGFVLRILYSVSPKSQRPFNKNPTLGIKKKFFELLISIVKKTFK